VAAGVWPSRPTTRSSGPLPAIRSVFRARPDQEARGVSADPGHGAPRGVPQLCLFGSTGAGRRRTQAWGHGFTPRRERACAQSCEAARTRSLSRCAVAVATRRRNCSDCTRPAWLADIARGCRRVGRLSTPHPAGTGTGNGTDQRRIRAFGRHDEIPSYKEIVLVPPLRSNSPVGAQPRWSTIEPSTVFFVSS
jgi:hypothetical protein